MRKITAAPLVRGAIYQWQTLSSDQRREIGRSAARLARGGGQLARSVSSGNHVGMVSFAAGARQLGEDVRFLANHLSALRGASGCASAATAPPADPSREPGPDPGASPDHVSSGPADNQRATLRAAINRATPQTDDREVGEFRISYQMVGGLSYFQGRRPYAESYLSVAVRSSPGIGGYYSLAVVPLREWHVLLDRNGSRLPVSICRIREEAELNVELRIDPKPNDRLPVVPSAPGY
jgi:hypothetical protein